MNKKNRPRLLAAMKNNSITPAQAAELLGRSESTIKVYLTPNTGVDIPDHLIELLELKLADTGRQ